MNMKTKRGRGVLTLLGIPASLAVFATVSYLPATDINVPPYQPKPYGVVLSDWKRIIQTSGDPVLDGYELTFDRQELKFSDLQSFSSSFFLNSTVERRNIGLDTLILDIAHSDDDMRRISLRNICVKELIFEEAYPPGAIKAEGCITYTLNIPDDIKDIPVTYTVFDEYGDPIRPETELAKEIIRRSIPRGQNYIDYAPALEG
jgi:hypothetical protein